ncbi:hypothetical protein RCL_jg10374.t2 [Rhizophagus clarus]|uniref:Uncharacterized protein n=1 Tax=Rhizophagus clarus TaxID=94130 RepID=A0A8H3QDB5_9GLOM|nr:hypothetical protein RCL_jg10374.t2 [Rhizophagus clarus]
MTSMTIKSCQNQYYLFGPLLNLIMATNIPGNYGTFLSNLTSKEDNACTVLLEKEANFGEDIKNIIDEHNHKDTVRWAGDHKP